MRLRNKVSTSSKRLFLQSSRRKNVHYLKLREFFIDQPVSTKLGTRLISRELHSSMRHVFISVF